jgi:hypothetical protein
MFKLNSNINETYYFYNEIIKKKLTMSNIYIFVKIYYLKIWKMFDNSLSKYNF